MTIPELGYNQYLDIKTKIDRMEIRQGELENGRKINIENIEALRGKSDSIALSLERVATKLDSIDEKLELKISTINDKANMTVRTISYCCIIGVTVFGAYYSYNNQLEKKFLHQESQECVTGTKKMGNEGVALPINRGGDNPKVLISSIL